MQTTEEQISLRDLVKQAAGGWVEHTEADERVLSEVQYATVMWCVTYLWAKGHGPAGAALLSLIPPERAKQLLESD